MAYPGNFVKFSFGGDLAGGEEWTNSINFAFIRNGENDWTTVDEAKMNEDLNNFTANLEAFFTAIRPSIASTTTLTWSKLAVIGPDGRYAAAPVSRPVGPINGGTTLKFPNQIALALSMQSDAWGARGKNGRIYLAGVSVAIAGDGLIPVSERDSIATAFADFINGLNDSGATLFEGNLRVVIASAVGAGAFNPVTRVRVGRVLDTMRSRRTSLVESYGTVELDDGTVEEEA